MMCQECSAEFSRREPSWSVVPRRTDLSRSASAEEGELGGEAGGLVLWAHREDSPRRRVT